MKLVRFAAAAACLLLALPAAALPAAAQPKPRNVIIFVADGLRYDSVTPQAAPTMYAIRKQGVDFANSHAVYPTVTTANASSIATGHYLGDTGDYGNSLYFGTPIHCQLGAPVEITFLEDDCVLRAVKSHFGDGYMGQTTLIGSARGAGYSTVIVGKRGPAAIQWLKALDSADDDVGGPLGVFVDDATNHPAGVDKMPLMSTTLGGQIASDAFGATGAAAPPFTTAPNLTQQAWLTSLTTQVLIPSLRNQGKPFVLLFWSRDPDTTQHSATDSIGRIVPGINSVDARQAVYNADTNLKALLDALKLWGLDANTDVFVTADHGFSTIGKGVPTADGELPRSSFAAGFVALDVAKWLGNETIFDPDQNNLPIDAANGERPSGGNAIIGPSLDRPRAMVVTNGGTDFIYVPDGEARRDTARTIYANLVKQPYVGALFVDDALLKGDRAAFAGALPMSAVNLIGSSPVPHPAIVIGFRSFAAKGCTLGPLMCAVEVADTGLQTGQGMHGTSSRADTRNFMAAIGPDFRKGFVDKAPVGNADIAPTIAHILGITLGGPGTLKGRAATEALVNGKAVAFKAGVLSAPPGPDGITTMLDYQDADGVRYFDAAGIPGRVVGLRPVTKAK